ncbi:MAG: hypothetical protein WBA41_12425, partial [Rivularia sp. (in: cyanobacteria)]
TISDQTSSVTPTQLKTISESSAIAQTISDQTSSVTPTQLATSGESSAIAQTISDQTSSVIPTQLATTSGESSQNPEAVSPQTISDQTSSVTPTQLATTGETQNPEAVSPQTIPNQTSETTSTQLAATGESQNPENISPQIIPAQTPSVTPTQLKTGETPKETTPHFPTEKQVTQLKTDDNHPIADKDTVPAVLTPGEFVINSKDAQKNLPLLEHINKGGTASDVRQKENTNSLISPSLGLDITKQRSSFTNNNFNNSNHINNDIVQKKSPENNYSSPPLIFQKANVNTSSHVNETPSQWSTVEELMNLNHEDSNFKNLNNGNPNISNIQSFHDSKSSSNLQTSTQHHHLPKGFAKGGEVKEDNISTEIKPVSETINMSSDSKEDDEIALEALAREVYTRLRQQLEIEKERQGIFTGRLPW